MLTKFNLILIFKYFKILFANLIGVFFLFFSCEDEDENKCINELKISYDPCIEIYDPVCGCNKKTYDNYCFAENAGVIEWSKGKCN